MDGSNLQSRASRNPAPNSTATPLFAVPARLPRQGGNQQGRLTWTFAVCILFGVASFLLAHVILSSFMAAPPKLEELSYVNRHQLRHDVETNPDPVLPLTKPSVESPVQVANDQEPVKRILVFGSHHTGTSVITRLIIEMGAYAGNDLMMLPGNMLKYNEHRKAVEADKRVMSRGHSEPRVGPWWVEFGFKWEHVDKVEQDRFLDAAAGVIRDLDEQAPKNGYKAWVLKDPRMAILAPQWISQTSRESVCVIVERNPVETSIRLAKKYNRPKEGQTLSVYQWNEFWEESMLNTLHACQGHEIVFAHHSMLVENPFEFTRELENALFGKVTRFTSDEQVLAVLGDTFQQKAKIDPEDIAPFDDDDDKEIGELPRVNSLYWTESLKQLYRVLKHEDLSKLPKSFEPFVGKREAYVTIVTGNDKGFAAGAIALAQSIRRFDRARHMVAMLSVEVTDPIIQQSLVLAGWTIVRAEKLEEPWYQAHPKCRGFNPSQSVRWGRMFSKLRIFSLPFDRVLYLDTDTILLRDVEPYFNEITGDFFAERSPSHKGINAGIMLIVPSSNTLQELIEYARTNEPLVFWSNNQVGCTEQELLNRFFTCEEGMRKLNDTRHFDYLSNRFTGPDFREELREHGARIAHCLTTKCLKPWDMNPSRLLRSSPNYHKVQRNCDRLMYVVWYSLFLSPELEQARLKLELPSVTQALEQTNLTYDQFKQEMEDLQGENGENFRRDWRKVEFGNQ